MWEEFGFSQNLYDHLPISANAAGERLLVGRAEELKKLMLRIKGRNAIPTLEGDIGVGKTSIISVAAYKLEQEYFRNGGPCFLALERPFQLDPNETADAFSERVYQAILIKLHTLRSELISRGINVGETKKLYDWLTSEQYAGVTGALGPLGGGISPAPNTSQGFTSLGFQNKVNLLLKQMFPSAKKGGVICVIDNLELLEKSAKAKAVLEAMRDKVLTAHGLIWVICGARGIVRGVASSPRLQGYLSKPIQIDTLPLGKLDGLIERRISEYAIKGAIPKAPVGQKGFIHIFRICNENLRTSLKFCSDFAEWIFENGHIEEGDEEKFRLLEVWLAEEADDFLHDTRLTPKPWEIFDKIIDEGGAIAPSDHEKFGYETPMAMRPQIKTLEDAGLVESTVDDTDQRRRTISVTPKGWLINYSRRGYPE
jgi:DNA-binding MarR family transcriptional regulator